MPTTPVTFAGAASGWPSSVIERPAGTVRSVICTFCGSTSRVTSWVAPALSVARRCRR